MVLPSKRLERRLGMGATVSGNNREGSVLTRAMAVAAPDCHIDGATWPASGRVSG
jgi:hypothetical protein